MHGAGNMHWKIIGAAAMSVLNNLKIVWKVALIVAVMGFAMVAVAGFGTRELSATVDGFAELSAAQSSALNLTRAQRRAETYHAALYAAAGVLAASAILLVMMPRYRYAVGADAAAPAEPAVQSA